MRSSFHTWTTIGGKGHAEDFVEASVLTSSWEAPDGSVGRLFVNPDDEPRSVSVQLDTRNASGFERCDVAVYSSASGEGFVPHWRNVELPRQFSAEIQRVRARLGAASLALPVVADRVNSLPLTTMRLSRMGDPEGGRPDRIDWATRRLARAHWEASSISWAVNARRARWS